MTGVKNFLVLKYMNHLGETIKFDGKNYFSNSYKMRDYTWNYESDFNKIKSFNLSNVSTKTLSVSIHTRSQSKGFELFNSFFEIFEKDVLAKRPGKFYLGDYYYTCYVISSVKEDFLAAQNLLTLELTIISDTNNWVCEKTYSFVKNQPVSGHGYIYGYPYQYSSGALKSFLNDALIGYNFKLIIYGPVINPALYIGGHMYAVNVPVEVDEYLEINCREKIIETVQSDGKRTSVINYRNRENYIFQKIPSGVVAVTWNNDFGFDLTLFDERSEPKWSAS
ncbi:uncharacterized protein BN706_00465 [Clostridium sp. CAG:557]|mgnify:FL=1|nr:uncharacterized protein BN706_00465 [Clostridium sp. CAG:557]